MQMNGDHHRIRHSDQCGTYAIEDVPGVGNHLTDHHVLAVALGRCSKRDVELAGVGVLRGIKQMVC